MWYYILYKQCNNLVIKNVLQVYLKNVLQWSNMVGRKKGISIRYPDSILRQIDKHVLNGEYSDRSDFFFQAAIYELRWADMKLDLVQEVVRETEKIFERRLHSTEYAQFIISLAEGAAKNVLRDTLQKA